MQVGGVAPDAGCLGSWVTFREVAANSRAWLRKMTCKDKASYESSPLYSTRSHSHTHTHTHINVRVLSVCSVGWLRTGGRPCAVGWRMCAVGWRLCAVGCPAALFANL